MNTFVVLNCSFLMCVYLLQFEAAMMTPGGRAKFVESMEGIVKGVKQVLSHVSFILQLALSES